MVLQGRLCAPRAPRRVVCFPWGRARFLAFCWAFVLLGLALWGCVGPFSLSVGPGLFWSRRGWLGSCFFLFVWVFLGALWAVVGWVLFPVAVAAWPGLGSVRPCVLRLSGPPLLYYGRCVLLRGILDGAAFDLNLALSTIVLWSLRFLILRTCRSLF